MPSLIINNKKINVEDGITIIQACELLNIEIPRFCYHERLAIAGNCRMCLVELENSPKLVASCAMPASDGMIIYTNSPKVEKARKSVMEFLLINHPLDCPVCDQGGECDLQDQAFKYGNRVSRFNEHKRIVKDKYMGPLIATHMTRCIHCTRCIRFAQDIAGLPEIGTVGRGENMEVQTYLEQSMKSELSGNVIDLCPVGALNSKPYAYTARSWELKHTESIDIFDAMGANIRVDSRGLEVVRILPSYCDDINEEWISDKSRFAYDGLKYQRLDKPYIKSNGRLQEASWSEALDYVANKMKDTPGHRMAAIAGTIADCESMFALKLLMQNFGCNNFDVNQFNYKWDLSSRGNYLFNTSIAGIDYTDLCLLVGVDMNFSAPVLGARLTRLQRWNKLRILNIGPEDYDHRFKVIDLGNSPRLLVDILNGNHKIIHEINNAKNPMMIIGDLAYSRDDGFKVLELCQNIAYKYNFIQLNWNGYNILHNHASTVGAIDLGFVAVGNNKNVSEILDSCEQGEISLVYLLGADEIDSSKLSNTFVIYQGHHGDVGANCADVILPGAAYTEKNAIYINFEGRAQYARQAVSTLGSAKEDWLIIKNISDKVKSKFYFKDLNDLRTQAAKVAISLKNVGKLQKSSVKKIESDIILNTEEVFAVKQRNFYITDVITRVSPVMTECTKVRNKEN
ncbi:NADH dehydrogenase (quinone), G subunit [Orientia chuto str. Dubai]|uniref:NADH-quinone oxidoreductase n=1 Tax=Orientia chuto str. Dubai TaxID=1359168 RepID=A0A0F3MJV9_9RICK|nr:NADH-quinone oxidoreductase subunit NuoG [Candidatus Orientia mediorientalis]KJV55941.1 NADH dehydrogenase (quinone), G subunit [Orientia chuto str. Dubai]